MPLIIAVVAIIVFFVVSHDNKIDRDRNSANRAKDMRKTNAYLERRVLDSFLRQGMTFEEAYRATMYEMPKRGFEPCIPKDAYGNKDRKYGFSEIIDGETSCVPDPGQFDSYAVKMRREEKYGLYYSGPIDESLYDGFPTTEGEYVRDLKRSSFKIMTVNVGEFITYPNYGTCEVIERNINPITQTSGYYVVLVISTGEIKNIKIGDSKIRQVH